MPTEKKVETLNSLTIPYGFYYLPDQDIFSTCLDAWQRDFGYTDLYDKSAVHFHMIFDKLPIYFNYQNRTWLLEIWKGQYGISTGCEIGLYNTDHILSPEEYSTALFTCVSDLEMLQMSFSLYKKHLPIAKLHQTHWWLTAFQPGHFSHPSQLSMQIKLTFPTPEMARIYTDKLLASDYPVQNVYCYWNIVGFAFADATTSSGFFIRLRIFFAQLSNRFWCAVYRFLTRPFTSVADRALFLYYQLPFAFRHTLRIRHHNHLKPKL